VTPSEIILEMIARHHSDSLSNSQEIWCMIETVAVQLRHRGYEIEDDLCRKYDSAYQIPVSQKWLFSVCLGKELLSCEKKRDYGYEKAGYCRYTFTDRLLFEDLNKIKKGTTFKKEAAALWEDHTARPDTHAGYSPSYVPDVGVQRGFSSDVLDLEKFEDYCFLRKPSRLSKDFLMNDIYYFCSLLYSLWTGKCWKKDFSKDNREELCFELEKHGIEDRGFFILMEEILGSQSSWREDYQISHLLDLLWEMHPRA